MKKDRACTLQCIYDMFGCTHILSSSTEEDLNGRIVHPFPSSDKFSVRWGLIETSGHEQTSSPGERMPHRTLTAVRLADCELLSIANRCALTGSQYTDLQIQRSSTQYRDYKPSYDCTSELVATSTIMQV